jgi:hypothetical protein
VVRWRSLKWGTVSNRLFALMIRTRSSIALWKVYIEYELREGNHDRAKVIFYRAIRECPWAKGMCFEERHFEKKKIELQIIP